MGACGGDFSGRIHESSVTEADYPIAGDGHLGAERRFSGDLSRRPAGLWGAGAAEFLRSAGTGPGQLDGGPIGTSAQRGDLRSFGYVASPLSSQRDASATGRLGNVDPG